MIPPCERNGWDEVLAFLVLIAILIGGIWCGELIGNGLILLMNHFSS